MTTATVEKGKEAETAAVKVTPWSWSLLRWACTRCGATWVVGGLADLRCAKCGQRESAS